MTSLQNAIQFITYERNKVVANAPAHLGTLGYADSIVQRNGFNNVLTVLGNAALDATEAQS